LRASVQAPDSDYPSLVSCSGTRIPKLPSGMLISPQTRYGGHPMLLAGQ
jgi:hypothetical protein